jgi:PBP1b-binding outer membrane lipoprotein LpoB
MKRNISLVVSLAIIIAMCIAGCKKSDSPTAADNNIISQSDQQGLAVATSSDLLLIADQATLDDGAASSSSSLAKVDTAITPIAWGRHFTSGIWNKTYEKVDDSTVIATITNTLTGMMWIRSNNKSDVQKSIVVNTTRNVKFVKVAKSDSTSWLIRYITPVEGTTTSSTDTISITDVKFTIGADVIDVTSPPDNDYLKLGGLNQIGHTGVHCLSASPNRILTVQATVVSSSPDSDVVVVHHPNYGLVNVIIRERMRLVSSTLNNDGRTYTRVYTRSWIGDYVGRHTIHITAFTRKSIYDNLTPVTSDGWGIPYIVQ